MNLPYVRTIDYLSPSSLKMLEESPVEFYERRCGPKEDRPERDPQGFPAAVGSAFDAYVKRLVAAETGLKCPGIKKMLREKVEAPHAKEAIPEGLRLSVAYVECGAMAALLKDEVTRIEPGECIKKFSGVPIRGDLDAVLRKCVPADWKVVGSGSPGSRSPTQGYLRLWDTKYPGEDLGPHKKYGQDIGKLNRPWATQLSMYGWLLGWPYKKPIPIEYAVDEVVVGNLPRVRVAQHRGVISVDFQVELKGRLKEAWRRIQDEDVVPEIIGPKTSYF